MDSQYAMMKAQQSVASIKTSHVGKWLIKFGKYKGQTYEDVKNYDVAYLKYMIEKGAFNDEKYEKINTQIKDYINVPLVKV